MDCPQCHTSVEDDATTCSSCGANLAAAAAPTGGTAATSLKPFEYYLYVLRHYAQFSGRARRAEYWYFVLFNLLIMIGLSIIDSLVGLYSLETGVGLRGLCPGGIDPQYRGGGAPPARQRQKCLVAPGIVDSPYRGLGSAGADGARQHARRQSLRRKPQGRQRLRVCGPRRPDAGGRLSITVLIIQVSSHDSRRHTFRLFPARFGDDPAITCLGHTLSYSDLDRLANAFAGFLHHELGLQEGDKLAIQLPNLAQYPVAVLAAIRLGVVVVNVNPLYTKRELLHQLNDSGAKAVVVLAGLSKPLAAVVGDTPVEHVVVTSPGDLLPAPRRQLINGVLALTEIFRRGRFASTTSFRRALVLGEGRELPQPELHPDSLAVLQYTGGTTGVSKGAMLSHNNMLHNLRQVMEVLEDTLEEGKEVIVAPLPLYHIFAFMLCTMLAFGLGARVILIPDPRNTRRFLKSLQGERCTAFAGLNTLFNHLCRQQEFRELDFSGLRFTVSGGMALMRDTAERWEQVTGCKVIEGYGLTEASPVVSLNPPHAPKLGTVGKLLPDTECRLLDSEGNTVGTGEPGELWIRGPQVMSGYWQRPEETREMLDSEGWLHTGDVAQLDEDGYLKIVDRLKDMIVVSGFNVYPNELEDEISKHPDVVECAAVGIPDPDTVEAIKLFVVRSSKSLSAQDIQDFARRNLTGYKIPKHIEFVDELPKSNVGKVLRRHLRDREHPELESAQRQAPGA